MDLIPNIIDKDLKESITKIKKYFSEPGFQKSVGDCERFLDRETGVLNEFNIRFDGQITRILSKHDRKYGKFTVRVYFPIDGICVTGSLDMMCNFALVRNAFNGNMSEKMLRMTYYDHELREVVEGSYIIISSLTCESCIGLNNKNLKEGILESAFIFGAVGMVAT